MKKMEKNDKKLLFSTLIDDEILFTISEDFEGSKLYIPFQNVEKEWDLENFDEASFNLFMKDIYEECFDKAWRPIWTGAGLD